MMSTLEETLDALRALGWTEERIASYWRRVERQMARHAEQEAIDEMEQS